MHSRGSLAAITVAMLLAAGIALAKSHGDQGDHGHHGSHGTPQDGGHGSPGGRHGGGAVCDSAAVAVLDAAVEAACPCDGLPDGLGGTTPWRNHGQYVRCVAHATRDQLRSVGLKRRCVKGMVPCAARSTCGKSDSVACVVTSTDTCVSGACSNDSEMACMTDADCTTSSCRVTSAARCTALGGVAGSGSCCTASPSGAFLDTTF